MMTGRAIVICIITAVLSTQSLAAESGCTVDGKTIAKGEQYNFPGSCTFNQCTGNNEWARAACGLVGGPQGWVYVPEDTTKPYPECCGTVKPPLDIVPDVLDNVPGINELRVQYSSGVTVDVGNELTPTQVKDEPSVSYSAETDHWYLLCMTDPDAPSRQNPTNREFEHWLVGNIPGRDIPSGEVLAEYIGAGPPRGTGLHRYVFLLYKQPGKLHFEEQKISKTSAEGRARFSIRKFADKYKLGDPIAVNIFQAQYDDYVPILHSQLGFGKKG